MSEWRADPIGWDMLGKCVEAERRYGGSFKPKRIVGRVCHECRLMIRTDGQTIGKGARDSEYASPESIARWRLLDPQPEHPADTALRRVIGNQVAEVLIARGDTNGN